MTIRPNIFQEIKQDFISFTLHSVEKYLDGKIKKSNWKCRNKMGFLCLFKYTENCAEFGGWVLFWLVLVLELNFLGI